MCSSVSISDPTIALLGDPTPPAPDLGSRCMWERVGQSPKRGSDGLAEPWSNAPSPSTCGLAVACPHRAEGPLLMRKPRLLIVLCALALTLAVALIRPLPSRADTGAQPTLPPEPAPPTSPNPIVPPLPAMTIEPNATRRPAGLLHKALRIPLGDKVVKYAKHFLGVPYVW